jgi:hypothetical protein
MRRPLALSLLAAVLTSPLGAQATTVATFSNYSSATTTEYQATPGVPVTSGGFDFYEFFSSNARNVLATWGTNPSLDAYGAANQPTNIGSSTAMFSTAATEIDMFAAGQDVNNPLVAFNLYSIDVANLYSTPNVPFMQSFNLTFFGYNTDFNQFSQTFAIIAPGSANAPQTPALQTLVFDSRWNNMLNVWWNQTNVLSQQHQFTNVTAAVLPEPSTYVLMLTGLGTLGLVAVRRRRA